MELTEVGRRFLETRDLVLLQEQFMARIGGAAEVRKLAAGASVNQLRKQRRQDPPEGLSPDASVANTALDGTAQTYRLVRTAPALSSVIAHVHAYHSVRVTSCTHEFPDESARVGECRFCAVGGDRMA